MKCRACARQLTSASSLYLGVGPVCAARLGIRLLLEPQRKPPRRAMRAVRRMSRANAALGLGYDDPSQQDLFNGATAA